METSSRIFHLDTECYLIYIGQNSGEAHPFVRVGISDRLPQAIKPHISSVIVSDMMTGNPIMERQEYADPTSPSLRFVGEPATLHRLKRFFESSTLDTVSFQSGPSELHEHGAFVYFFDTANVTLVFERQTLFNLRRRAMIDMHYPQRTVRIKDLLLRNFLRWRTGDLAAPGFVSLGGALYPFGEGNMLGFNPPAQYFEQLALAGFDPDLLTTMIVEAPDTGLLHWLLRARTTGRRVLVRSRDGENARNLVDLLNARGALRLFASIEAPLREYKLGKTISLSQERRLFTISSADAVSIRIDMGKRLWWTFDPLHDEEGMVSRREIVEGMPYTLQLEERLDAIGASVRKIDAQLASIQYGVSSMEGSFLRQMSGIVSQLAHGELPSADPVRLRTICRQMKRRGCSPLFLLFVHNLDAILRMSMAESSDHPQKRSTVHDYLRIVEALLEPVKNAVPGVSASIHLTAIGSIVLYDFSSRLSETNMAEANSLANAINDVIRIADTDYFDVEEDRLYDLLLELKLIERRPDRKTELPPIEAVRDGELHWDEMQRISLRNSGSNRRRSILGLVAALLLILAGGALFLLLRPNSTGETVRVSEQSVQEPSLEDALPGGRSAPSVAEPLGQAPEQPSGQSFRQSTGEVDREEEPSQEDVLPGGRSAPSGAEPLEQASEQPSEQSFRQSTGEVDREEEPSQEDVLPGGRSAPSGAEPLEQSFGQSSEDGESIIVSRAVGNIEITLADLVRLTNFIASMNGYRRLGEAEEHGPNPDWIFPTNRLVLPDSEVYLVRKTDTIWDISTDYVEEVVGTKYLLYLQTLQRYRAGSMTGEQAIAELRSLQVNSFNEHFAVLIAQAIEDFRSN